MMINFLVSLSIHAFMKKGVLDMKGVGELRASPLPTQGCKHNMPHFFVEVDLGSDWMHQMTQKLGLVAKPDFVKKFVEIIKVTKTPLFIIRLIQHIVLFN